MTKITIDIDKPYNDKNVEAARKMITTIEADVEGIDYIQSAHDRLHMDVYFPNDLYVELLNWTANELEDMYFILFRLAAGDDIRRLRTDAKKFFKGEDIFHWLPSKDDYRKVAEREK